MNNNLKDYREKELKNYVLGNIMLIMLLMDIISININANLLDIGKEILSASIISSVIYIYVFIFDAIIPGNWKNNICNLCRVIPGEVIFDKIKSEEYKDKRFTKEEALKKYEDIYNNQLDGLDGEQRKRKSNSLWYAIYKKHENETKIFISNRDYLLCRDLCIVTLWIAFIYLILYLLKILAFSREIIVILGIELVLTNIAMRGKQRRFAITVIATDIHTIGL